MDRSRLGTVEVQWPGGVRNRLYKVFDGERLVLPEIPCRIDSKGGVRRYTRCVSNALGDLKDAGVITKRHAVRLYTSAIFAFFDERRR